MPLQVEILKAKQLTFDRYWLKLPFVYSFWALGATNSGAPSIGARPNSLLLDSDSALLHECGGLGG